MVQLPVKNSQFWCLEMSAGFLKKKQTPSSMQQKHLEISSGLLKKAPAFVATKTAVNVRRCPFKNIQWC